MLLENLLDLPLGTCVFGKDQYAVTLLGTIESTEDGSRLVLWSDGSRTRPLGFSRDYDLEIAARIELTPVCRRPFAQEDRDTALTLQPGAWES